MGLTPWEIGVVVVALSMAIWCIWVMVLFAKSGKECYYELWELEEFLQDYSWKLYKRTYGLEDKD